MINSKYKALMIDVDGTIVENSAHGKVSPAVRRAINSASKKIHVGLATSRPFFMVKGIFAHLELSGPSIINGGAQVIDATTHRMYSEQVMEVADAAFVYDIMKKSGKKFYVAEDEKDLVSPKSYTPKKPLQFFSVGFSEKEANGLMELFLDRSTLSAYKLPDWTPGKLSLLVSHASATKQHGILEVAKILGIQTHEIIGVGDGQNDFPLLMACGLKVAMGNAVPDLKAIADYVAPPVDKDGVADVINKFVLKQTYNL